MDSSITFLLAILALLGLMFVFLFASARRRDADRAAADAGPSIEERAEAATANLPVPVGHASASGRELERSVALQRRGSQVDTPPAPPAPVPAPLDEEALGVTRRQVLNRGIIGTFTLALTSFGAASVAMLWPSLSGGFGSKIRVGKFDEIMEEIADKKEPFYLGAGRLYVTPFPQEAVDKARGVQAYAAVMEGYEGGVAALYQKCPHLGCRVPWCTTSQWFECPCHGSQYNRVGEKKGGPAPRGMDRFAASVENGVVVVDTSTVIPGPPIGTNTTGQESEGPHCIGAVSEE